MTLLAALCVHVLLVPAFARVGERAGACRRRYGEPVVEREGERVVTRTYRKGAFLVDVYFVRRRWVWVYPTERAAGIAFRKPGRKENEPLSELEIRTFLRANGRKQPWAQVNLHFEAARQSSASERDRLVEQSRRYLMWRQQDGTVGVYDGDARELVIRTPELARLTEEEKAVHTPDPKPDKDLEGF